MRVLHCIWRMGGGGAERQLGYVVEGQVSRGWDVHVAVVFDGANDAHLSATGCRIHRIGGHGRFDPMIAVRLLRLIRRLRPAVIQTWLTQMDILAGGVATLLRRPWVLSERSREEAYRGSVLGWLRARIGRRADACVANSEGGREYWARMGVEARRLHVVPNGTPVDAIDAAPPLPRPRTGEALVVSVGRFSEEKNPLLLLEALALLMRRRPVRAVLCGDGPMRRDIESRAASLGIGDRLTLAGFVSNVWSWLKAADVMVTVARFEGHPNGVLEAMACGVPLVVSDIPAHRAFLDEAAARFVGEDPRQVADALEAAIDGGRPTEQTRCARARVMEFSIDNVVQRYEEVYHVRNLRTRERH